MLFRSAMLSSAHAKLSSLSRYDAKLASVAETLSTGIDLIEEAARDAARYLDRADLDGERFAEVDRRVCHYYELAPPFCCPAPKRLLTKEPLVAPKELTITKKEGGNAAGYVGNGQFHLS